MRIAQKILLAIAMVSFALILSGLYLGHMERLFPANPQKGWFHWPEPPQEGLAFWVIGTWGLVLSSVTAAVLAIISAIKRIVLRA